MIRDVLFAALINQNELDVPKVGVRGGSDGALANVLELVFAFAGAIALIVITIAGFKYTISQGNPQETAKAKNTIIYALVGLGVCIFAFAIVRFVLGEVL